MPADRVALAARQAALLRSLLHGGGFPDGVDAGAAAATALALRRKRARAVAKRWPALTHALGTRFDGLFAAYALQGPPTTNGSGVQDGLRFARSLPTETELTDAARAELLRHRARVSHGVFLGRTRLRTGRVLVVARMPVVGTRAVELPTPRHAKSAGPKAGALGEGGPPARRRSRRQADRTSR